MTISQRAIRLENRAKNVRLTAGLRLRVWAQTDSRLAPAPTSKPARATVPAVGAKPGIRLPAIRLARATWSQPPTHLRPSADQAPRRVRLPARSANGLQGKPSKRTLPPSDQLGPRVRGSARAAAQTSTEAREIVRADQRTAV